MSGALAPSARLPVALAAALAVLGLFWLLWLGPESAAVEAERLDLQSQQESLTAEIERASQNLAQMPASAASHRDLLRRGVLGVQSRQTATSVLQSRAAELSVRLQRSSFKPVVETRHDQGGVTLIQRTVPIELMAEGAGDLPLLALAQVGLLPFGGLLRVERLELARGPAALGDVVRALEDGQHATAAILQLQLGWAVIAPPRAGAP